jgi:TonB family protein
VVMGVGLGWGQEAPAAKLGSTNAVASSGADVPCVIPTNGGLSGEGNATRIPAKVMAGRVLTHPSPVYPKEAKARHVQGVVVVHALIGKDGTMEKVEASCGPEELRSSALDAVKQWTYIPYELDGKPTRVDTTVTVIYAFGRAAPPMPNAASWVGGVEVVELAKGAPELAGAKKKDPKYPKEAKQAGISGEVTVSTLIDVKGHVESAKAVAGPEMLRDAAVQTVERYRYPKYAVNGVPKMVLTTEVVIFKAP